MRLKINKKLILESFFSELIPKAEKTRDLTLSSNLSKEDYNNEIKALKKTMSPDEFKEFSNWKAPIKQPISDESSKVESIIKQPKSDISQSVIDKHSNDADEALKKMRAFYNKPHQIVKQEVPISKPAEVQNELKKPEVPVSKSIDYDPTEVQNELKKSNTAFSKPVDYDPTEIQKGLDKSNAVFSKPIDYDPTEAQNQLNKSNIANLKPVNYDSTGDDNLNNSSMLSDDNINNYIIGGGILTAAGIGNSLFNKNRRT